MAIINYGNTKVENLFVCSLHFVSGKPSGEFNLKHVDWAPSINLGLIKPKLCLVGEQLDDANLDRHKNPPTTLMAEESVGSVIISPRTLNSVSSSNDSPIETNDKPSIDAEQNISAVADTPKHFKQTDSDIVSTLPKGRRNRCVINLCRWRNEIQNDKESGVTFFKVPKSSFNEWRALVPCLKTTSSHLCSRHFDEADIIKGQTMSTNEFYPYLRWKLSQGALPKHLLEGIEETDSQVTKSKCRPTEVQKQPQPKVLKAVKSPLVSRQDQIRKSLPVTNQAQSTVRTVLQSLSPNKETPLQKNNPQPLPNQKAISPRSGDDHDYALPLQEELQAVDESQDPDPLSLSPHDVLVVQMDDCQTDANTSQQISSTAEDQIDHDYAFCVREEDQPKHPNPILLSSAPNVQLAEPIENQDIDTSTSDVATSKYLVDDAAFRCFSSYVKLPSQSSWVWSLNKKDNILCCSNCSLSRGGSFIIKTVRIISESEVSFLINGNTIPPINNVALNFTTYQELSALICSFNVKRCCEGIRHPSLKNVKVSDRVSGVKDTSGKWRSKHCAYITDSIYQTVDTCSKCNLFKKYLQRRAAVVSKKKEAIEKRKEKVKMYKRMICSLEKKNKERSDEIETWRRDFRKLHTKWKRKIAAELKAKQKTVKK
ncbi:hypothetical protein DAPPUDRAFT_307489 [Daphnia pulex]|uniref:THAP-type domain-containing protein n=1 Tax=Daphnia pulex TaxID=6669 RepID=E9H2D1_DAPPU|nr:hypothetical protein DAPPUDRAFT_307489 [Daphnia pulex]|eukprot:EFX74165.1 hypothetical protein DAPPUDRAFT_307489 [Daphnia pulex]